MRIAICDNQKEFLLKSEETILSICRKKMISAEIECFHSTNNLIAAFNEDEYAFDLVLLNIYMPKINGQVCAKKLRSKSKYFKLVFMTSYKADLFSLFQYDIRGFVPKSMLKEFMERELINISSETEREKIAAAV